jgi:predicted DNA-binding protein YlxM (UPF0122 family)
MEERENIIKLYEVYKSLLTRKQQMYFENYYYEDLSLSEIADNNNVSKALVSKNINNTIDKLNELECKLKFKYKEERIEEALSSFKDSKEKKIIEEILYNN